MSKTFDIEFDYRFDSRGFFDDPARRKILELAASAWSDLIGDEFDDVPVGAFVDVTDPADPTRTTRVELDRSIDDVLIFVGSSDLGTPLGTAYSRFNSRDGDAEFANCSYFRGQGPTTDFEPYVGSIGFNDGPGIDWSSDPDGPVAGFFRPLQCCGP